jgi:hypothetical protein
LWQSHITLPLWSCCCPLATRSVLAALVVEIVGSIYWISGNITCDWITTWGTEHLLDGTWLLVHNLRYMYVSVH